MKDITLTSILAILEELLGSLFWAGLALAVVVALLFVVALVRQRGFRGPAARFAFVVGIMSGLAAFATAPMLTQASFENVAGLADWTTLGLISLSAFAAVTVSLFAVLGSASRRPRSAT